VGSYDDNFYAINPDGTEKWRFSTGDNVSGSAAIGSDGTIYVGSEDFHLYALNPDGTQQWNFATASHIHSTPAIGADGSIYFGSQDHNLYAINPGGTEKWRFGTGDLVNSSPAIGSDGTVYVGSRDYRLYAVYGESGGLADTPWPMFRHDLRHTASGNFSLAQTTVTIDFEDFEAADQGKRFGTDLGEMYETFDWAYMSYKDDDWGSWTVQDGGATGVFGASFGSDNWLKARASSNGKGAKITRQDGFQFVGLRVFTDTSNPAFLHEVDVTWRTTDDATYGPFLIDLADGWLEVTAADIGAESQTLKAMWFNGAPSDPNAAKFGLDDFTVILP
jgi:hypothetical protein